uniref:Ig-like domain-containing protein n=1 Tax=Hucho hucho TaxID=62062 RepID=A0A4W5NGQ5_9TELE
MDVLLVQTQTRLYTSNHNLWILQHTQLGQPVAVLTLQPNWTQIFSGETVTMRCDLQGGGDSDWQYEWHNDRKSVYSNTNPEYRISPVYYTSNSGSYTCQGVKGNKRSETSDAVQLTVSCKGQWSVLV